GLGIRPGPGATEPGRVPNSIVGPPRDSDMTKKRDVRGSDSNTDRARRALSDLATRVRAANEQFRGELQEILDLLEGETFPSAQENRAVVDTIDRLLRGFGLRLKCMRRGCGRPASLTCRDSADRLYVF